MKTLILFEMHHLGDAVLSIPFVREASQHSRLHIVCRAGSVEIFQKWLPFEQIHVWEPWWEVVGWEKWTNFWRLRSLFDNLRALNADEALCVWADSRIHFLMHRTKAARIIGFPVNRQNFYAHERPWRHRRMRLGQLLGFFCPLQTPLLRWDYQQSHLTDWQQLTQAAEFAWNPATPWFNVPLPKSAPDFRLAGETLWLIHPGGRLPTKRWPLDRFQHLLSTTFRTRSALLIQPPDSPGLKPETARHRSIAPANLSELLSFVQTADAVLCNDSLVSHLAAALGKPVWTIFGSGNPRWFAPFGNEHRVIASDVCPVRPCIDRCVYPSPVCLEAVSPADVEQAIEAI